MHNTLHGSMNVVDLRSGSIKHRGDSAILTAGKFDALVSHTENGVMTVDSFANWRRRQGCQRWARAFLKAVT